MAGRGGLLRWLLDFCIFLIIFFSWFQLVSYLCGSPKDCMFVKWVKLKSHEAFALLGSCSAGGTTLPQRDGVPGLCHSLPLCWGALCRFMAMFWMVKTARHWRLPWLVLAGCWNYLSEWDILLAVPRHSCSFRVLYFPHALISAGNALDLQIHWSLAHRSIRTKLQCHSPPCSLPCHCSFLPRMVSL